MINTKELAARHVEAHTETGPEVYLRIGEAAERTGLTQRTIRYYEELGLLSPPGRTQGDFRLFSQADLQRLSDISRLKHLLGFSLAEIKKIVEGEEAISQIRSEFRVTGDAATRLALLEDALALTVSQLGLLDRKMAQMAEMKLELEARRTRYIERRAELEGKVRGSAQDSGRGDRGDRKKANESIKHGN